MPEGRRVPSVVPEGRRVPSVAPERGRISHVLPERGRLFDARPILPPAVVTLPVSGAPPRGIPALVVAVGRIAAVPRRAVRDFVLAVGGAPVVLRGPARLAVRWRGPRTVRRRDPRSPAGRRLALLAAAAAGAFRFIGLVAVPERRCLDAPGALSRHVPALGLPVGGVEVTVVVLELVEVEAAHRPAVHAGGDRRGIEVGFLEFRIVQPTGAVAVEGGADLKLAVR
ncbi:hypothetical protein AB0M36_12160 [Actinoplanes sp. NPDC051346]|uniref:hypothetical protein n=1 Tax=Actinoplanes sp. NPDC051346 TaxID=3155048 RepID=UPI00343124FD